MLAVPLQEGQPDLPHGQGLGVPRQPRVVQGQDGHSDHVGVRAQPRPGPLVVRHHQPQHLPTQLRPAEAVGELLVVVWVGGVLHHAGAELRQLAAGDVTFYSDSHLGKVGGENVEPDAGVGRLRLVVDGDVLRSQYFDLDKEDDGLILANLCPPVALISLV